MEPKTQVQAENGKQELFITRVFDLPVESLFRAHIEPELLAQWMGTRVLNFEPRQHGSWRIETPDAQGNVAFRAHGVFHTFEPNRRIVRTFEMENPLFAPQLEFLEFEQVTDDTSKLTMQLLFQSVALRDQLLKMPFAFGLNMAHDRLQSIFHST